MSDEVQAHEQRVSHKYIVHYPEHEPRAEDPWHRDFEEWKRRRKANKTYFCDFARDYRDGDMSECTTGAPLEGHHREIEFSLKNGLLVPANFAHFEKLYPGITKDEIGKWIDSDPNLELLCQFHHRGHGGVHVASQSDFEAQKFIRNLLS